MEVEAKHHLPLAARCTEPYWISRSSVRGQGHMGFLVVSVCVILWLPAESTSHHWCIVVHLILLRAT